MPDNDSPPIGDLLQVVETRTAEPFVAELFQRKFGSPPPDYPRHFVVFYAAGEGAWLPAGYINFWARGRAFMGGGMVIDERVYRRMPAEHRRVIKDGGGIAETLLREAVNMLPDNDVVWGYVGDSRAEKVDLRVGFVHTHVDKVIAYWNNEFDDERRRALVDEIATLGPF